MKGSRPDYLRVLKDPVAPEQQTLPGVEAPAPVNNSGASPKFDGMEQETRDKYLTQYEAIKKELLDDAPTNVVREMNWALFDTLVSAIVAYRDAREFVIKYGAVIKSPSGYPIQSPYVSHMNKQAQIMARTSAELGLTLASRLRVKAGSSKPPSKANPFTGLKSLD